MRIESIKDLCLGCSACFSQCPKRCIEMKFDDEGFYYPTIDKTSCVQCGICDQSCPALEDVEQTSQNDENQRSSYYGWLTDPDLRFESSSGGAFTALANSILKSKGVAFGAAFNYETEILEHRSTEETSLKELRKSKYVESFVGDSFRSVQKFLKAGRPVLFCGTPCQVAGLKKVVKDPNGLLTTVDFVCHGVPSARLFREHIRYVHRKEKISALDFRPKTEGWSSKSIRLVTRTRTRSKPFRFDNFYYGFMSVNAFLRRSCYQCRYRNAHRSDITIADFWGYRAVDPKLNDERGLSLIICNNERGRKFVESLEGFELHPVENSFSNYVYTPKDYSKGLKIRAIFYERYFRYGFERAANLTYMQGTFVTKLKYFIKKTIKTIVRANNQKGTRPNNGKYH